MKTTKTVAATTTKMEHEHEPVTIATSSVTFRIRDMKRRFWSSKPAVMFVGLQLVQMARCSRPLNHRLIANYMLIPESGH